jgi:hypothetical protein
MLQLRASLADRGEALPMAHVAEVLDAAIRGLGPGALGVRRRTSPSPGA